MAESAWLRDNALLLAPGLRHVDAIGMLPARAAPPEPARPHRHHRTIFISDIHLGTRVCKAELLNDFLAHNSCETLFLVGDIVDGWRLKHRWFWPQSHNMVLEAILQKVDEGTRVVYVPGNHDEVFRSYCGRAIAGVEIMRETVHVTADGRRLLVLHGDQFDAVIAYARWFALLGDWAYGLAIELNEWCLGIRRVFGLEYWSLAAFLKQKVKNALEYICHFEGAVACEVRARGLDGVVCGHIHHAAARIIDGVLYLNDGDWVESCTALVEDRSGQLEILCWADKLTQRHDATVAALDAIAASTPA